MIRLPGSSAITAGSSPDWAVSIEIWSHDTAASSGRNEYADGRSWMIAAYPKQMWTAVVPTTPSSARLSAATPNSRAFSGRACMYGSSICTMSAPAAKRSTISSWTAPAYARASSASLSYASFCACCDIVNGPGHRHLDRPARVRAQELHVAHLHRIHPLDRSDHARHRVRMAAAVERRARVVDVDARERGREPVRVALPARLAVRDDVEPGPLLVADREQRRVVLRLLQVLRVDAPQLGRAHARREPAAEALAIDQPVGLRVRADEARRQSFRKRRARHAGKHTPGAVAPVGAVR